MRCPVCGATDKACGAEGHPGAAHPIDLPVLVERSTVMPLVKETRTTSSGMVYQIWVEGPAQPATEAEAEAVAPVKARRSARDKARRSAPDKTDS